MKEGLKASQEEKDRVKMSSPTFIISPPEMNHKVIVTSDRRKQAKPRRAGKP
jgi:hypothetical protein